MKLELSFPTFDNIWHANFWHEFLKPDLCLRPRSTVIVDDWKRSNFQIADAGVALQAMWQISLVNPDLFPPERERTRDPVFLRQIFDCFLRLRRVSDTSLCQTRLPQQTRTSTCRCGRVCSGSIMHSVLFPRILDY